MEGGQIGWRHFGQGEGKKGVGAKVMDGFGSFEIWVTKRRDE